MPNLHRTRNAASRVVSTALLMGCSLTSFAVAQDSSSVASSDASCKVITFHGYDDCIEIKNQHARVVLCPAAGGRVLHYGTAGKNVLYLPTGNEGWVATEKDQRGNMTAGRFDVGPEKTFRHGEILWSGKWDGAITGDRSARLTSQIDEVSGVQLIRDFTLSPDSSHLQCDQIIRNLSSGPISVCHWSRTFAIGGGHAWLPRSPRGRFPNGYVMYREKNTIGFKPEQANVRVREDDIWITGPPEFPKLGFDSHGGWMAYFAPNDLLFVKRFATYPDRAYNEIAGLTASVYYPERRPLVELEPIGPAEDLKPNEQSSFTEHWFVVEHAFPKDPDDLDQESLRSRLPK